MFFFTRALTNTARADAAMATFAARKAGRLKASKPMEFMDARARGRKQRLKPAVTSMGARAARRATAGHPDRLINIVHAVA